jgi:uncharacterized membrane protein
MILLFTIAYLDWLNTNIDFVTSTVYLLFLYWRGFGLFLVCLMTIKENAEMPENYRIIMDY